MKKLDLVGDHRFVRNPIVNVEMVGTWIDAGFALRGPMRRFNRRSRLGTLIVCGNAHQPWTMKRSCMFDRTVWRARQPTRRNAVAPSGFVADGDDATPTDLGSGRADERWFMGLTNSRQITAFRCRGLHCLNDVRGSVVALSISVEHRNLADGRCDLGIRRCRSKGMAATRRGTKCCHAFGIDIGQRTGQ